MNGDLELSLRVVAWCDTGYLELPGSDTTGAGNENPGVDHAVKPDTTSEVTYE